MQKKKMKKSVTTEREFFELRTTLHELFKSKNSQVAVGFTHGNCHYEFDKDHPADEVDHVLVRVKGKWEPIAPADVKIVLNCAATEEGWY